MSKRIFKAMLISTSLTLLMSLILIFGVMYAYFIDMGVSHMRSEMVYVKKGYLTDGIGYFDSIGKSYDRITLIASDGKVLYDSEADITKMNNHLTRPEVKKALDTGVGTDSRLSDTLSETMLYYAVKLDDGSILRLASARYSFFAVFWGVLQPFLLIIAAIIIISVYMSWKTAKHIVKPINALDLENPEKNTADDELEPLLRKILIQKIENDDKINELNQKQNEFNTITENMQEGFMLLNNNAEILTFNKSAEQLLGEVKTGYLLAVNRGEVFRQIVEDIRFGRKADHIMQTENKHYQLICNPVKKEKMPAGAVLLIIDVTEKLERERLRREFSANVSHELKTPLTSISGYAEIMMNGITKGDDNIQFAGKIYSEAKRLIRLVGDIIDLSKLDEGGAFTQKQEVDLYALSLNVKEQLTYEAEQKEIQIIVNGEKTIISGFEQPLEEMIFNLCDNAIKYNKNGGMVIIAIWENENCVKLTVADSGIGIPKEEKERVFERFYRVDKARSTNTGGTGLGLSIVKRGAILHNAEIFLESELNKGTEISIVFKK